MVEDCISDGGLVAPHPSSLCPYLCNQCRRDTKTSAKALASPETTKKLKAALLCALEGPPRVHPVHGGGRGEVMGENGSVTSWLVVVVVVKSWASGERDVVVLVFFPCGESHNSPGCQPTAIGGQPIADGT